MGPCQQPCSGSGSGSIQARQHGQTDAQTDTQTCTLALLWDQVTHTGAGPWPTVTEALPPPGWVNLGRVALVGASGLPRSPLLSDPSPPARLDMDTASLIIPPCAWGADTTRPH